MDCARKMGVQAMREGAKYQRPLGVQHLPLFFTFGSSGLLLLGLFLPQWSYYQCLQVFSLQLLARF